MVAIPFAGQLVSIEIRVRIDGLPPVAIPFAGQLVSIGMLVHIKREVEDSRNPLCGSVSFHNKERSVE